MVSRDAQGYYDAVFTHRSEIWQLKEFQVNPLKVVGCGERSINSSPLLAKTSAPDFGLRPISEAQMKELTEVIGDPKLMAEIMRHLMRERPVSVKEALDTSAVALHGPVIQTAQLSNILSDRQKALDQKLAHELKKLVQKKFRHTLYPYV